MSVDPRKPSDEHIVQQIIAEAVEEAASGDVVSTTAILAAIMPQVPPGFSTDDLIRRIVLEASLRGMAVSFG